MVKKRFNYLELATYSNDPFSISYGGKSKILPKDRLLFEKGSSDSLGLYLDLMADQQVYFCWDKQISEITSKNWFVLPGGDSLEDKNAADYVEEKLNALSSSHDDDDEGDYQLVDNSSGFDNLTRGLGLAMITGMSVAEIVWKSDKDYESTVDKVIIRDPRRFIFANEGGKTYLKMLTKRNSMNGIYLPKRKFICHRFWAIPSDDLYGSGMGRLLYYPVQWKKEILTLWLIIADKYSDPTVIAKHGGELDDVARTEFERAVSNISRDMFLIMPDTFDVQFSSPSLGNSDILAKLTEVCDSYVSKTILGEANTGEHQASGVLKENVSNSIRIMKAKAFSDLLSETLNKTLIKWLVQVKFGDSVKYPTVWRNFDDSSVTIDTLTQLKTLGFRTTVEYAERITGIPLEKMDTDVPRFEFGS